MLIKKVLSLPDVLNACSQYEIVKKYDDAKDLYYLLSLIYKDSKPIKKSLKAITPKATREVDLPKDIVDMLAGMYQEKQIDTVYEISSELLSIYPKNIFLLNLKANCLRALERFDEALEVYEYAIRVNPDVPELYNNMGNTYNSIDNAKKAKESFEKALGLKQNYFEAQINLAEILKKESEFEKAIEHYAQGLKLKPDFIYALNGLGESFYGLSRYNKALETVNKALNIDSRNSTALSLCSKVYLDIGKSEEALHYIDKALEYHPSDISLLYSRAYAYYHIGDIDKCKENCEKALAIDKSMSKVHRLLSSTKKYTDTNDKHILDMESLLEGNENIYDIADYSFALSKAYEDVSETRRSFELLKQGNSILKQHQTYRVEDDKKKFENIKKIFENKDLSHNEDVYEKTPIFIVGMPRSGTSLVEQILSAHSSVHGCGELHFLGKEVESCLTNKSSADKVSNISENYLKKIDELGFGDVLFTDKMPHNFRYIGFIFSAFSNAKVINLQREPMAVSWSIYKTYFPAGGLGYASSFESIAEFYSFYLDVMKFWNSLYTNRIFNMDYELLTEKPRVEIEKLLNYCELEWEDECLDFHKQNRVVSTASAQQVREKIYSGSSKKWEKFKNHLEPLESALIQKGVI